MEAHLGFFILYSMGFVNHQVSPVELLEDRFLFNHHFVGGHTHIPLSGHHYITDKSSLVEKMNAVNIL